MKEALLAPHVVRLVNPTREKIKNPSGASSKDKRQYTVSLSDRTTSELLNTIIRTGVHK